MSLTKEEATQMPPNTLEQKHPRIRTEVLYREANTGYFPILGDVKHGFSWGAGSRNMSYQWEPAIPDTVTARIEAFLAGLNMASIESSVIVNHFSQNAVVDVTKEAILASKHADDGTVVDAQAIFTTLKNVPLTLKAADCTASLVWGLTEDKQPVVGAIHSGRRQLESFVPKKAVEHLVQKYGASPAEIQIAVAPFLSANNHTIRVEDTKDVINSELWKPYTSDSINRKRIHLDMLSFLLDQYRQAGISGENIQVYLVDTFEAARLGKGFSHRYATSTEQPERNGRFMMAIQIG